MSIIIFVFIAILVACAIYLMWVQHVAKETGVCRVEAGPIAEIEMETHNKKSNIQYSIWDKFKTMEGKTIDKAKYRPIEVDGPCMGPLNIKKGDILLYEVIENKNCLKAGDLVFLEINDPQKGKLRKIRIIEEIILTEENNKPSLVTYYFANEGNQWFRKKSSKNHTLEQVIGIVRYKVSKTENLNQESVNYCKAG